MTQIVSSISGIEIYAPSAGNAPTNSADVSAIASAYQVVSATGTQLYAGTAHVTSINGDPISASRAGNAANASMATSAYYDGTGRLISSLPDSATVSSIASSYAESAASGKLDTSAQVVTATGSASGVVPGVCLTSVNDVQISAYTARRAESAMYASFDGNGQSISACIDTVSANSASWGGGGGGIDSATCSAIASSYAESAASSKLDTTAQVVSSTAGDGTYITSINGMGLSGQGGGGGDAFPAEINYGGNVRAVVTTGFQDNTATRPTLFISSNPAYNSYPRMMLSENHATTGKSGAFLADAFEFYNGTGVKVFRADPTGVSGAKFFLGTARVSGNSWDLESGSVSGGNSTSNWFLNRNWVSGISGTATWQYGTAEYNQLTSVHDTVSANSASWGGGGGVDSATVSAIASAYGYSALSSIYAGPGISYGGADDPMISINYDGAGPLGTDDNNVLICKTDGTTIGVNAAGELVSLVGGGVDSATVSAIASGYAESAVSSKADSSSLSSYALSSDISGVIDTVSSNSATWGGGATGDYVEKSALDVTIGSGNSVSDTAFAQGYANTANNRSFAQGANNSATAGSFAQGANNTAKQYGVACGAGCYATGTALAIGYSCTVSKESLALGSRNSATKQSFVVGEYNTADGYSFAHGLNLSAYNTAFTFGKNNLRGNGDTTTGHSAAFVIGDGTAANARHDLMLVTRDGEITMFSSTADTTGTGIMSAIRAISAAATGGGGGVVTATGSASATAYSGFPLVVITSYLVSSINGSAILPYGYSTLSSNSAKWTSATSAVSANSANWDSAYSLISGVTALMDSI